MKKRKNVILFESINDLKRPLTYHHSTLRSLCRIVYNFRRIHRDKVCKNIFDFTNIDKRI